LQNKVQIQKQAELFKFWKILPYVLAMLVFVFTLALIAINYDKISQAGTSFLAKHLNLKVKHIYITGVEYTNPDDLASSINIRKGDSLFLAEPSTMRKQLELLPWVRLAQVQRIFPDSLKIKIFEHKAIATILFNEQRWALNSKGELIDIVSSDFNYLLELSGDGAKENAAVFFSLFTNWTDLLFLSKQAEFVGKRRWNLYLENGSIIMLPEENVRYALEVLKVLDEQQRVLSKKSIKVDLRNVSKHIIIDEKSNHI
jgi:cell division protein FtsQ